MKYFLRYTENAIADLDRNYSLHASDFEVGKIDWLEEEQTEIEVVASAFNCDVENIVMLDNGIYHGEEANGKLQYFQKLDGLCGFELDSEDLDDAIEEAENFEYNYVYNSVTMQNWAIFEGQYIDDCPEGVCFFATKLAYTNSPD